MDCKEIQPVHSKGDQSWVFFGRNDAKAETPVLWPPHVKSWLIGKDSDAGRHWGQEEKGMTEDEMAGWHHWPHGHGFGWTPGVSDGQGGLACCDSWGCRVRHDWATELNWIRNHEKWKWLSHLWPHGLQSPWNSPGQNTGVDSLSLLQGIFSTQGSNPGLLHCRWILYQLSHNNFFLLEVWVTYFHLDAFSPEFLPQQRPWGGWGAFPAGSSYCAANRGQEYSWGFTLSSAPLWPADPPSVLRALNWQQQTSWGRF